MFVLGELRLLIDVNDLQVIATFEVLFANGFDVGDGADRIGRLPRYKQAQHVLFFFAFSDLLFPGARRFLWLCLLHDSPLHLIASVSGYLSP